LARGDVGGAQIAARPLGEQRELLAGRGDVVGPHPDRHHASDRRLMLEAQADQPEQGPAVEGRGRRLDAVDPALVTADRELEVPLERQRHQGAPLGGQPDQQAIEGGLGREHQPLGVDLGLVEVDPLIDGLGRRLGGEGIPALAGGQGVQPVGHRTEPLEDAAARQPHELPQGGHAEARQLVAQPRRQRQAIEGHRANRSALVGVAREHPQRGRIGVAQAGAQGPGQAVGGEAREADHHRAAQPERGQLVDQGSAPGGGRRVEAAQAGAAEPEAGVVAAGDLGRARVQATRDRVLGGGALGPARSPRRAARAPGPGRGRSADRGNTPPARARSHAHATVPCGRSSSTTTVGSARQVGSRRHRSCSGRAGRSTHATRTTRLAQPRWWHDPRPDRSSRDRGALSLERAHRHRELPAAPLAHRPRRAATRSSRGSRRRARAR
jgi:hypothetical protein